MWGPNSSISDENAVWLRRNIYESENLKLFYSTTTFSYNRFHFLSLSIIFRQWVAYKNNHLKILRFTLRFHDSLKWFVNNFTKTHFISQVGWKHNSIHFTFGADITWNEIRRSEKWFNPIGDTCLVWLVLVSLRYLHDKKCIELN